MMIKLRITKYMADEFANREIHPKVTGPGVYEFDSDEIATIAADCEWAMDSMAWHGSQAEFLRQYNGYSALLAQIHKQLMSRW